MTIKKEIYIWGAGKVGEAAYMLHKNNYEILGFLDSNSNKWGTLFHGYQVMNPKEILNAPADVIVAIKSGIDSVAKELAEMGINEFILFDFSKRLVTSHKDYFEDENAVIVKFSGGLGNQMFHYMMYRNHELNGHNVYAEVENNLISSVFPKITIKECSNKSVEEYTSEIIKGSKSGVFTFYREPHTYECNKKEKIDLLLNIKQGYLIGNFQIYEWANRIRDDLIHQFKFMEKRDSALVNLKEEIKKINNSASIHVRRGDYFDESLKSYYGNICTDKYYEAAVNYVSKRAPGCYFFVFSNDIDWVKRNMELPNAFYISKEKFEDYEDWYDMYLMSLCKYNIIANSTFSWWGAWLNDYQDKEVIAPEKWINGCEYPDIYPKEWITINCTGEMVKRKYE